MNVEPANNVVEGIAGSGENTVLKWFSLSAGMILAITGVAKVWTALGDMRLLAVVDPLLGIRFRHLMLAAGVLEVLIAVLCLWGKANKLATLLVAWLSTNFAVYRLGLWWMGWHRPCGCLGNLTDALHISPQVADNVMKGVLAYLLIGSYGLLFWEWRERRREKEELRMKNEEVVKNPPMPGFGATEVKDEG